MPHALPLVRSPADRGVPRAPSRHVSPNYFPRRRGFGASGASSRCSKGTTFYEGCFVKPPDLHVHGTTASDGCSRRFRPRVHNQTRGCDRGGSSLSPPTPSGNGALPSIRARRSRLTAAAGSPYPAYAHRAAEPEGGTPSRDRGAPGAVLPGPRSFHGSARPAFASSSVTCRQLTRRPPLLSSRERGQCSGSWGVAAPDDPNRPR